MGVRLQPSTESTRDRVQLRQGDEFDIDGVVFRFEYYEAEEVQVASSAISVTAVVDLEEEGSDGRDLQVSGDHLPISTPAPSKDADPTILDTPSMLSRHCAPVKVAEYLIGEIAGHAIQGNEDSQKWSPDPGKREILWAVREAKSRSLPRSQTSDKASSTILPPRPVTSILEDSGAAGSLGNDLRSQSNSPAIMQMSSAIDSSKREDSDPFPKFESASELPTGGSYDLDVGNVGTPSGISGRTAKEVKRNVSGDKPAEQDLAEYMSRRSLVQHSAERLNSMNGATAAESKVTEESPYKISGGARGSEEKDRFSVHSAIEAENTLIRASMGARGLLEQKVSSDGSSRFGHSPPETVSEEVSAHPATVVAAPSIFPGEAATEGKQYDPISHDSTTSIAFRHEHSGSVVMDVVHTADVGTTSLESGAEDTQESTRQRSDHLLKVAVDSQQPSSSQTDGLPVSDIEDPKPYLDGIQESNQPMAEVDLNENTPSVIIFGTHDEGEVLRAGNISRIAHRVESRADPVAHAIEAKGEPEIVDGVIGKPQYEDEETTASEDGQGPHSEAQGPPIVRPQRTKTPCVKQKLLGGQGTVSGSSINSKRKLPKNELSEGATPSKVAKIRKTQNVSNSQDGKGSTIVVQPSFTAPKSARARGFTSKAAPERVEASPSARTRASVGSSQSSGTEIKPRILFASSTNIDTQSRHMNFLQRQGAVKVHSVQRCNLLCVGKGKELKKTSKLIQAIASGIEVVTDDWILQSVMEGRLLDPLVFRATDPEREAEWGVTVAEAIDRGKQGRQPFQGWTILFTPTLKQELGKSFAELKEIATHAGAKTVRAAIPRKTPSEVPKTLLLAAEGDDDVPGLQESGWRCHSKDVLTLSVLRGALDPESDEFLLSMNEGS